MIIEEWHSDSKGVTFDISYLVSVGYHNAAGAAIRHVDSLVPDQWYINGKRLSEEEEKIAKDILSCSVPFEDIPRYSGHPLLKYFCEERLKSGE